MNLTLFLLALFDGIAYAALVFIVAVGLTLIFGLMRILNVAHGSLYAVGAYITASLTTFVVSVGLPPIFAFPCMLVSAILIGALLGGPLEWLLLRRIYHKPEVLQLLGTFAIFMILEDVQRLVWGTQPIFQSTALQLMGNVRVFSVNYTVYQLILLPIVAISLLVGLRYFLRRTVAGKLITATTEDRETAQAIGALTPTRSFF
jgi:branched-chain amino acid transport system permease protein